MERFLSMKRTKFGAKILMRYCIISNILRVWLFFSRTL